MCAISSWLSIFPSVDCLNATYMSHVYRIRVTCSCMSWMPRKSACVRPASAQMCESSSRSCAVGREFMENRGSFVPNDSAAIRSRAGCSLSGSSRLGVRHDSIACERQ
eukprot:1187027-Rhodomonas_salina.5